MNAVHQSKKIFSVKRELKESLRFRVHSTMSKGGTSFHEIRERITRLLLDFLLDHFFQRNKGLLLAALVNAANTDLTVKRNVSFC